MEPKCQDMWFEAVYKGLEGRAWGKYEHLTVDNLTFFEENTRNDAIEALRGNDMVRKIWNARYGSLVRQLPWRFLKLSHYPEFHARLAEKHPALPCMFWLFTADFSKEDGGMSQTHPSDCYFSKGAWRGCDICNLLYALDSRRSQTGSVEGELRRHIDCSKEYGKTKELVVMFNGVGLSITCSWDASHGRPSMLEVSGPLGVVLHGTDWDRVLYPEQQSEPEIEKMELPNEKKAPLNKEQEPLIQKKEVPTEKETPNDKQEPPVGNMEPLNERKKKPRTKKKRPRTQQSNRVLEYLQRGAIEPVARQKEQEKEMLRKKREQETVPPDAHLVCCHDIPRDRFIHREKDGLCWETHDAEWQKKLIKRRDASPRPDWYYDDFFGWVEVMHGYRKRRLSF